MNIWNLNKENENEILSQPLYQKNKKQGRIVALGYFDGVHRGHQEILKILKVEARKKNMISDVHSFTTPPISKKNKNQKSSFLLTTDDEKLALFEKYGIDEVFLTPFEKEVEQLSPEKFLEIYISGLFSAKAVITGEDYRFGKNRVGDVSFLKKWGEENHVEIFTVPALYQENQVVSSTWIRRLFKCGDIEMANKLLGYPLSFESVVEKGYQIGRTIQFPTANMRVPPPKIIPRQGVYASVFEVDRQFFLSISNIGIRPTMNRDEKMVCLETMVLDRSLELYGKQARVFFLHFIRAEMKFDSVDALSMQMKKDTKKVRQYHEKHRSDYSVFFQTVL